MAARATASRSGESSAGARFARKRGLEGARGGGKGRGGPGRLGGEEMRLRGPWSCLGVAVAPRRAPRLPPSCFLVGEVDDKPLVGLGWGKLVGPEALGGVG